jgi:hypothetical protein
MMVMLGAPTVPGCDMDGPPGPAPAAASPTPRAEQKDGPTGRRGRLIAGERVWRIPSWPAAETIDAAVRGRMPDAARAAVARSPVPVLVPADPELAASAELFASPTGYALSARRGGVTLAVQASRQATLLPHVGPVPGNTRMRGVDGWVSVNDGIRTAAWIEHGTAYALDLECFAADSRECGEDALRAAVEGLVYVGGEPAPGGQEGAR